ncbi:hypothetical protein KC902_04305 [Candidatus Kaiserbacteria bacterium]|nr:hypothetical protein [Candidatus Kaiserbacteria bacterium]
MKRKSPEWLFDFVLSSNKLGTQLPDEIAEDLMNTIIEFAEARNLSIGGGFEPLYEAIYE